MKVKKYFTLIRARMIESFQYRANFVVIIAGNLVYLTIVFFLWRAIFASAETKTVNGMSFYDTLIYLVLSNALQNFMEMSLVWEMEQMIRTGKIVLELLKPFKFRSYIFWLYAGRMIMKFVMTFIPTYLIVLIVTKGAIHMGVNQLLFMISVIMSMIIKFCIDFFIGTICLYTQSIWGINLMKQAIILLFSGAAIPIAFFPDTLRTVAYCLPFQAICNTPLIMLTKVNMHLSETFSRLFLQFVWCVLGLLFTKVLWKRSVRKITVNGG